MTRANHREVAVIERGDGVLAEPFGDSDDAGVDHTEAEIRVRELQVAATAKVAWGRRLDAVHAVDDIVEERQPGVGAEALMAPVVDLGEDQHRDHEIGLGVDEQARTPLVIRIVGVEGGEQVVGTGENGTMMIAPRRTC